MRRTTKKKGTLLRGIKFLVSHGYSMEAKYNFSLLALKELFQKYSTLSVGLIVENKLAHYKIQTLSVTLALVDILAQSFRLKQLFDVTVDTAYIRRDLMLCCPVLPLSFDC